MMNAPGTVTSQPSVATPPMLAMMVGIMKMPAPIMLPATSMVAGNSPILSSFEVIACRCLWSSLLGKRLRHDLRLNGRGLGPEVLHEEGRELPRCIELGQRTIGQKTQIGVGPFHRDAVRLTGEQTSGYDEP